MEPNQIDRSKLRQGHGMTVGEMEKLALKQSGQLDEEINMIRGNRAKGLKDRYFLDQGFREYKLPEHEKHIFHIAQETRSFNGQSGEKLSQGYVQKYDKQTFEFMNKNRGFEGQTAYILHDPRVGTSEEKEIKPLGLQTAEQQPPANRQRFAETQLRADRDQASNDPNAPPDNRQVTGENERGGDDDQAGGTEGQEQTQNTDTTPNDDWTVPELKQYAKANDIALESDDVKADILKKIRKASKE